MWIITNRKSENVRLSTMAGTFTLDVVNKINTGLDDKLLVPVTGTGQTMYELLLAFQQTMGCGFSFTTIPDPGTAEKIQSITVKGTKVQNDHNKNNYWKLYQGENEGNQDLTMVKPNVTEELKFVYQTTTAP